MEGPLLRVLFFLVASRGGCGEQLGQMCYPSAEGAEPPSGAFRCPGPLDGADAQFCCGTCSAPFCCESRESGLDPARCPGFRRAVTTSNDPPPKATSRPPPGGGGDETSHPSGKLNYLWLLVGIIVTVCLLWNIGRNFDVFQCSWNHCRDSQEEIEMEERRSPPATLPIPGPGQSLPPPPAPRPLPPPAPRPPPPPPPYEDDPPPYSLINLASLALPPAVTRALLRMIPAPPTEGGAPAPPTEGGAPAPPAGAKEGAPAPPTEGGAPAPPPGPRGEPLECSWGSISKGDFVLPNQTTTLNPLFLESRK